MGSTVYLKKPSYGGYLYDEVALNLLLPMHIKLDKQGDIIHVAPTISKLFDGAHRVLGRNVCDFFQFIYPKDIINSKHLHTYLTKPLVVRIKGINDIKLKAVAVPIDGTTILINFSFGTSLLEGINRWNLNSKDFSYADSSVEMLYLIEVQSALLEESQSLNNRLNGQWKAAEDKAYTDPLTGLSNRRGLDRHFARLLRKRTANDFTLMLIDLDRFKRVNDTLGHAAGDKVLQNVSEILLSEIRAGDIVVRNGGDEFVIILDNIFATDHVSAIAKRIIAEIERPILWQGKECNVGASIGIVQKSLKLEDKIDTYLQAADDALYHCKENGRGQYSFANIDD